MFLKRRDPSPEFLFTVSPLLVVGESHLKGLGVRGGVVKYNPVNPF